MRQLLAAMIETGVGDIAVPAVSAWGALLTVVLMLGAWMIFGRKRGGKPSPKEPESDS